MTFGSLQFKPTILVTMATVFFASVFIALGDWQLGRAAEKRALIEQQKLRAESPAAALPPAGEVAADIDAWRYRPVRAEAEWLPERQFLLDNRVRRGVVGFHVLTPARMPSEGDVVLVNRGWVPQGETRKDLPVLRDLDNLRGATVTLEGDIYAPYKESFRLDENMSIGAKGWPRVVQFLDFKAAGRLLGAPVAPFVIRMAPDNANGFVREWSDFAFTPEKHTAYAWQWFALAAGVIALFLALNIKRRGDGKVTP